MIKRKATSQILEEAMSQREVSKELVLKRLKRIEGQARGIGKMILDNRDCEDVVTQLVALRSAVESVGAIVLNNYMNLCFRKSNKNALANIDSLARSVAIWGRVRVGDTK
jgi:DNA-binding FrmR family transcriptional regulator